MTPAFNESGVTLYQGHVIDVLQSLPDASVNCCITSPPYWGLRDYGLPPSIWGGDPLCTHEWLDASWRADRWGECDDDNPGEEQQTNTGSLGHRGEIKHQSQCSKCGAWRGCFGLEPTPGLYVEHATELFREVRRVLRDDGTLWLNLGDSYANDGKWGGKTGGKPAAALHGGPVGRTRRDSGLKPKDLVGIPWRVALALQEDGWYLRSDIIWAKPAPMPESVTDRPTRSHEYIFLLAKSERYYYDHEAIKEPSAGHGSGKGYKRDARLTYADKNGARGSDEPWKPREVYANQTSKHLAADPQSGQRRLAESVTAARKATGDHDNPFGDTRNKRDVWTVNTDPFPDAHFAVFPPALIPPCVLAGCPVGGTVLDPFSGAATTAMVAKRNHRKAIGCDLNGEYIEMSARRLSQEVLEFA